MEKDELTMSQRKALKRLTAHGEWPIESIEPSGDRGDVLVIVARSIRLMHIITPRGKTIGLGQPGT
jgi:hypothetical protein